MGNFAKICRKSSGPLENFSFKLDFLPKMSNIGTRSCKTLTVVIDETNEKRYGYCRVGAHAWNCIHDRFFDARALSLVIVRLRNRREFLNRAFLLTSLFDDLQKILWVG